MTPDSVTTDLINTVPVAIIGAGPVGLTAAMALSHHGVETIVFERHAAVVDHPRGHVINARSMEIFRRWGLDAEIGGHALDADTARRISWATSLVGDEIGRLDTPAPPAEASPCELVSCPQDQVEQVLLAALHDRGVDVRYATEITDLAAVEASETARSGIVLTTAAGDQVEARYVIGADGASSRSRRRLGIDMTGPPLLGNQVNISFEADLSGLVGERLALLTWILHPKAPGVFINMGEGQRWVFNMGYDPERTPAESFTQQRCAELLHVAIGVDVVPVVRSVRFWRMAAQVADTYRSGDVFLCGDSAHRFPPTGGLGANTGIADAHNLAWKLAQVLDDTAAPSLLDSYEAERRPIAVANSAWSLENSKKITETGVGPFARATGKTLAAGGVEADALRVRIRSSIDDQLAHFAHLGQDLGYCYGSSDMVIGDGPPPPPFDDVTFVATTHPGARLPHVELSDGRSSLDVVGSRYCLLVAEGTLVQPGATLSEQAKAHGVEVAAIDDAAWASLPGMAGHVALLIRPDDHIAMRVVDFDADVWHTIRSIVSCVQID